MKKARANVLAGWPVEGLPLNSAIFRLAGDGAVAAYNAALDAYPPESPGEMMKRIGASLNSGAPRSAHEERRRIAAEKIRGQAWWDMLEPLLKAWKQGELFATCRRGDPFAEPIIIPPPGDSWFLHVVDLNRSIIRDPVGRGKLFDLRFFIADAAPKAVGRPAAAVSAPLAADEPGWSSKQWLGDAVKRIPPPVERRHGWKIEYAERVHKEMMKAAKQNPSIKPCKNAKAVATKLYEYELWPE